MKLNLCVNKNLLVENVDENTTLIYDPIERSYHTLNHTAKFILNNCTVGSMEELIQLIKQTYDVSNISDNQIESNTLFALEQLLKKNILVRIQ